MIHRMLLGGNAADASRGASEVLQQGARDAGALEQEQFGRTNELLNPFIQGGGGRALNRADAMMGLGTPEENQMALEQMNNSPGQQFLRQEGIRGLENQLAAGGRGGGGRLRAIMRANQQMAQTQIAGQQDRLMGRAQFGLNAAGGLADRQAGNVNQRAQTIMQGAGANAAGITGAANARQGAFNSLLSLGGGLLGGALAGGA